MTETQLFRNTGAPFARADGSVWATDEVYAPTTDELKRRAYKLRSLLGESPEMLGLGAVDEAQSPDKQQEVWPLKMTPKVYLGLHAAGQYANLARTLEKAAAVVEAQAQEETTDSSQESVTESEESPDGTEDERSSR